MEENPDIVPWMPMMLPTLHLSLEVAWCHHRRFCYSAKRSVHLYLPGSLATPSWASLSKD